MRNLVRDLIAGLMQQRELILCQVVETRGSTPQKAGSIMIIDADGGQLGTLGGGCVENEVKQRAIHQTGATGAAVHSFILDHDYAWADGLICGGKMVILSQPLHGPGALDYFRTLDEVVEQGQGFVEAVVIDGTEAIGSVLGNRVLFDGDRKMRAAWPAAAIPDGLIAQLRSPAERPKPSVQGGFAWLPSWPRIRLIIVGAGHIGQAVAALAAQADFDVWVVDDRQQYASRARFPAAQRLLVGPIEEALSTLAINRETYALIVTRGHGHDQEALYHLAATAAAYVGLIGSRRKIRLIFESLREAGVSEIDLKRVAAPVGLEIGSQSVAEIAISIVAELIARRNLGPQSLAPRAHDDFLSSANQAGQRACAAVANQV